MTIERATEVCQTTPGCNYCTWTAGVGGKVEAWANCEDQRAYTPAGVAKTYKMVPNAWCPTTPVVGEYAQIDSGQTQLLSAVVVRGRGQEFDNQYVTSFKVSVSDSQNSGYVEVDSGKIFAGNVDAFTSITVKFNQPVMGRYVRILPQTYKGYMALRWGIILFTPASVPIAANIWVFDRAYDMGSQKRMTLVDCQASGWAARCGSTADYRIDPDDPGWEICPSSMLAISRSCLFTNA
jgi:hypothetical protein